MMLGVSALIDTSAAAVAAAVEAHESGGASGGSSEVGASSSAAPAVGVEENERIGGGGGGGNRWPRQETLSLLKIRSDMDVTFRDASLKGPLWEEVSRKMAELGFQRSAKKCKEKFENVFKYHKRTKDGRATKADGKSYRFFDQLEALENTSPNHFTPPPPPRPPPPSSAAAAISTVPSASPVPLSVVPPIVAPINSSPFQQSQQQHQLNASGPHYSSHPVSNTTSSSTSSDEDIQRRRGRKRKWKDYFEKLMTDVVQKQEDLQKKFLEALERRERDRIGREEAWRLQEMARMHREHDLLVQERSIAAAKDAAVISFLQKVTGETAIHVPITNANNNNPPQPQQPPMQPQQQLQPLRLPPQSNLPPPLEAQPIAAAGTPPPPPPTKTLEITPNRENGGGDDHMLAGSSRWPKAEVEALIKLRTDLEIKYQENGPKGPLWEEISKAMNNLGYKRSSKRCKEKWENINKYFKKVKESNKKRPEDSKTCPYFRQLDAIYKERAKNHVPSFNLGYAAKPDNAMTPIMARPEQQWPQPQPSMHEADQDNDSENHEDDEDEDEDDEVGDYEMIANKQASSMTNTVE